MNTDTMWRLSCPFCVKIRTVATEQIQGGYRFQCLTCGKVWSEPSHTINLNRHGENGYIKPRRI